MSEGNVDEALADMMDQVWLEQHPWAIDLLPKDLLMKVHIPKDPHGKSVSAPQCKVCKGDPVIGLREFAQLKSNRMTRMLQLNSSFNREYLAKKGHPYVYLVENDARGTVRRYPRSQAYAPGFSLYDEEGNLTKPADGKYLMQKDKDD